MPDTALTALSALSPIPGSAESYFVSGGVDYRGSVTTLFTGRTLAATVALGIRSSGAAFDLQIQSSEVLTANRALNIVLGDAARTLTIGASASVSGSNTGDQTPASLGLLIGTNVQAWDADLDAIAGISATSGLLKKTAANTWSLDTSTYATQAYADALVVGLLDDRGNYDASVNTFPASGGSGSAGAILKGDLWTISVAGTLGGHPVTAGDVIRALADIPGQTDGNWAISENNFGYVALNQSLLDGKIYVGNGSNIGTAVTPSGDVTITNAGVTAIGALKVTSAMLNSDVFSTAHSWGGTQTFTAPALGTPSALVLTSATGLPPATGIVGWPANASGALTNDGSGNLSWAAGGGSGTVNSGTQYQIGYYATGSTAISGNSGIVTNASNQLLIGAPTNARTFSVKSADTIIAAFEGTAQNYVDFDSPSTAGHRFMRSAGVKWVFGVDTDDQFWFTKSAGVLDNGNPVMVFDTNKNVLISNWYRWAGQAYLGSDQTNATATLASSTLSITLQAGRKYAFKIILYVSNSTASEGIQIDFNGGTATATAFRAHVTGFDTALTVNTQTTALNTAASAATFTGAGMLEIHGSITVNAGGTFIPQFAENTHVVGTATLRAGSHMLFFDMP